MNLNDKIYIAGHTGLVGSAIVRKLENRGFTNILTQTHKDLDLTLQANVRDFFKQEKPDYVILAAGKVCRIARAADRPAMPAPTTQILGPFQYPFTSFAM